MANGFRVYPRTDRYFLRLYLLFLGLCAAGAATLVLLADISQQYRRISAQSIQADRGVAETLFGVARYYTAFVPQFMLVHLLPVLLMFAGVLAVTRAASLNEFIALRAVGVSLRRLLAPTLAAALAIGLAFFGARDLFMPRLMVHSARLMSTIRSTSMVTVTLTLPDGDRLQSVTMGHFDSEGRGHNFLLCEQSLEDYRAGVNGGTFHQAREVFLDPQGPAHARQWAWAAASERARRVEIGPYHRAESAWPASEKIPTPMTPAMFARHSLGDDVLTAAELRRLAPTDPVARQELHQRRARPWAGLVMTLLGTAAAMMAIGRGRRPSYVANMLYALGFALAYILLQSTFTGLGQGEAMHPALAAWAPVFIGAAAGGLLLHRVE